MGDVVNDPTPVAYQMTIDARDPVAKALNRIADALFRQAKAAERAVALQEQMVAASQRMAENQIDFDRLVSELEQRRG